MGTDVAKTAYFSLLRWRRDATRDEARNIAVLLFSSDGKLGGIKTAPASARGKMIREQGLLGSLLAGLEDQFSNEVKPTLTDIWRMHETLQDSLLVTEPKETAVPDETETLGALYRAYVSPHGGGGRSVTKGVALGNFVRALEMSGIRYELEKRIDSFAFDVAIRRGPGEAVADVLSFATSARDWSPVEHDAGHFLYALKNVRLPGFAVVQPPTEQSHQNAYAAHERVQEWFKTEGIGIVSADSLMAPMIELPV